MAIIGKNTTGSSGTRYYAWGHQMLHTSAHYYDAAAGQEVFEMGFYNDTGNSGTSVEIGVYDITDAVDGAPLVGTTATIAGDNSTGFLTGAPSGGAFALTSGRRYVVAWRVTADLYTHDTYSAGVGRWGNALISDPLESTWDDGNGAGEEYSFYAETQEAAGGGIAIPIVMLQHDHFSGGL